jgi:hypothetical protein
MAIRGGDAGHGLMRAGSDGEVAVVSFAIAGEGGNGTELLEAGRIAEFAGLNLLIFP